jgi:hypothetical protein
MYNYTPYIPPMYPNYMSVSRNFFLKFGNVVPGTECRVLKNLPDNWQPTPTQHTPPQHLSNQTSNCQNGQEQEGEQFIWLHGPNLIAPSFRFSRSIQAALSSTGRTRTRVDCWRSATGASTSTSTSMPQRSGRSWRTEPSGRSSPKPTRRTTPLRSHCSRKR